MSAKKSIKENMMGGMLNLTVLIAGLGYMVDMFDLMLFNMVRVKSLTELGLEGHALTDAGLKIVNWQMAGLLLGACLWGVLADKIGRKPGLFASIFVYSMGTLATSMVQSVDMYALARFVTAVGLAGELGAGITLISEKLSPEKRGAGVMLFITMGFFGIVLAGLGTEFLYWRHLYVFGGVAGLLLLLCRMSITESGIYGAAVKQKVSRGSFMTLLKNKQNVKKYLAALFMMAPPIFISQILWALSPEIGRALGIADPVKVNFVLLSCFTVVIFGDIAVCLLSEKLKSRSRAVAWFLLAGTVTFSLFVAIAPASMTALFVFFGLMGFFLAYWVVGGVWIAEQFGTNIRATVSTTIPNFARGLAIPMNFAFGYLKTFDTMMAVTVIGVVVFLLALVGWAALKETYGRDLGFVEPDIIP